MKTVDFILYIVAIVIPPIPVIIRKRIFCADTSITLGLYLLGWIPGIIYAFYILSITSEEAIQVSRYGTAAYVPVPPINIAEEGGEGRGLGGGSLGGKSDRVTSKTRGSLRGTSSTGILTHGSLRSLLGGDQGTSFKKGYNATLNNDQVPVPLPLPV